jgi:hypothetical protein
MKEVIKWDKEIAVLEEFFKDAVLPTQPLMINACAKVINARLFVDTHLSVVKKNNGSDTFKPYLMRLRWFMKLCMLPQVEEPAALIIDKTEQSKEVEPKEEVVIKKKPPAQSKARVKKKGKTTEPKENNSGKLQF